MQHLEAIGLNLEEVNMSTPREKAAIKNKELIKTILGLKPGVGDKRTKVSALPKDKKPKPKKSTASKIKKFTDLFEKGNDEGSDVQELEDYVSGYGNPIGTGPADVSFGPYHEGAGYSVFKKGGRLKKTKKKAVRKRAALRGQRSELRGS